MLKSKTTSNENTASAESKSPREAASRLLQEILKTAYRKLHSAAAHWREDDEHVHQLRVASRRALAALRFFKELIPDRQEEWFRKKLKAMLRASQLARDLDVLIKERLSGHGKSKRNLLQKCRSERKNAQQTIVELRKKMDRNDTFRKHIRHLAGELKLNAADKTANETVSTREWCLKRFAAISQQFSELKWCDFDVKTLHRLRIKTKQLRYMAEIVEQMTDTSNLVELMTALTAMQQQLGLLQDHVAAKKQLLGLVRFEKKHSHRKNLEQFIKDEDLAIAECIDQFRNSSEFHDGRSIHQCLENIFQTHPVVSATQRT